MSPPRREQPAAETHNQASWCRVYYGTGICEQAGDCPCVFRHHTSWKGHTTRQEGHAARKLEIGDTSGHEVSEGNQFWVRPRGAAATDMPALNVLRNYGLPMCGYTDSDGTGEWHLIRKDPSAGSKGAYIACEQKAVRTQCLEPQATLETLTSGLGISDNGDKLPASQAVIAPKIRAPTGTPFALPVHVLQPTDEKPTFSTAGALPLDSDHDPLLLALMVTQSLTAVAYYRRGVGVSAIEDIEIRTLNADGSTSVSSLYGDPAEEGVHAPPWASAPSALTRAQALQEIAAAQTVPPTSILVLRMHHGGDDISAELALLTRNLVRGGAFGTSGPAYDKALCVGDSSLAPTPHIGMGLNTAVAPPKEPSALERLASSARVEPHSEVPPPPPQPTLTLPSESAERDEGPLDEDMDTGEDATSDEPAANEHTTAAALVTLAQGTSAEVGESMPPPATPQSIGLLRLTRYVQSSIQTICWEAHDRLETLRTAQNEGKVYTKAFCVGMERADEPMQALLSAIDTPDLAAAVCPFPDTSQPPQVVADILIEARKERRKTLLTYEVGGNKKKRIRSDLRHQVELLLAQVLAGVWFPSGASNHQQWWIDQAQRLELAVTYMRRADASESQATGKTGSSGTTTNSRGVAAGHAESGTTANGVSDDDDGDGADMPGDLYEEEDDLLFEDTQDTLTQESLLHMEAAQARSPSAARLTDEAVGTVIDVGFWQASHESATVLQREDIVKGGIEYLTRWRPLRELLDDPSGPMLYKQFTERFAVPGDVALLRKALIARQENPDTRVRTGWGKHLRTASRNEPSISLGARLRYAAGREPAPYEIECIHWHGYEGTTGNPKLFYRVSWKGYADQHVIDTEGVEALHVAADKMDDGPMLRAFHALMQRPRVGAELEPTEDAVSGLTPTSFSISPIRGTAVAAETAAPRGQAPPGAPAATTPITVVPMPHEDPLLAFLNEADLPTTECTACGGLFNMPLDMGHPVDACPRAPASLDDQQRRHAQVAAFMATRDRPRAETLLQLATDEDGLISYPFSQLTPVERAALRTHMATVGRAGNPHSGKPRANPDDARVAQLTAEVEQLRTQLLTQRAADPPTTHPTPLASEAADVVAAINTLREELAAQTRKQTIIEAELATYKSTVRGPQTTPPPGDAASVQALRDALAAEKDAHIASLRRVTVETNRRHEIPNVTGSVPPQAWSGVMVGFDKSLNIAQWRWVMKKFHIGGELGTDRRVMYYPAGLCNGWDANCMPIQGAAGVRTPQMWMPAHMFIEAAKVSYNTNPDSLWQRERASVDKSQESASGSLTLGPDGKLSVKGLQRKLIIKPSQAGWPPVKYISDWFQGIVGMADELEKVDEALQHTYSPVHTLPALCHQHRLCMAQVYDTRFSMFTRNREAAFDEFVAMEEAVREHLCQTKPASWADSTEDPIVMKIVKAHALRAENAQADANSPGGRPAANPGVPSPTPAAPNKPGAGNRTDLRTQVDFPSLGAMVSAYGGVRTRNNDEFCMLHNFSGCTRETETAGGLTFCKAANGVRRLHICVRCGGSHAIEGAGKCSKTHLR